MGVYYTLANLTKREKIDFSKLPVSKKREIAGNPAAAAIVAWYLLENSGDRIGFYGDETPPPYAEVSLNEVIDFVDKTAELIDNLIEAGILVDCGVSYQDVDEPEIYLRDIRNAWMPPELLAPKNEGEQNKRMESNG